ncbi:TetR/AcrR family transcriptional regulator [Actinophytocola gossypii]|uniref:TetR/AcrR family transcriptional regulator C-terminal domain-containing protein n=1 Tax=Actinophytocola gossypii TaxID=2812003 RepID=A0ABT2J630_9PSEU|nr:TetR/AcrR family transcriptional regulator [Actinophytocola gossypii]MCT2583322.1 TetR/AcrR family transcriptional regulator C-terminal domain-containing protein [Actinophytocola gossypii]
MRTSDNDTANETSVSFGGAATAARSMELLWGTKPPPTRGRKPGMTVETIVAAAIEVADAEGLDGLSMRRVAEALGAGTMSLYRYVPSKAELHDLMLDTVLADDPPLDLETGGWRAGLERFARSSLDGYVRHPWLLRASLTRGAMGPNQTRVLDAMLTALEGTGLTGGERMAVIELVTGYVRGVAQQRVDDIVARQRSGLSDEQFWTEFAPLLDGHLTEARFPALTRLWRDEEFDHVDSFEFGLARVLDGIERLVESR